MTARDKPLRPKKSTVQLMFNTHDPLEEIHRAGRAQEDDHFRKRDQELLVALRAQERRRERAGHSALYPYALPKVWRAFRGHAFPWGHDGCVSWVWRDMAGQRGMGRACGAESTRLAPTVFRRADGVQPCQVLMAWTRLCSLAALTHRKKATHEQVFLVHASWRKLRARASHRSPGPRIARADRSRCPAVRTRVGSAHSRCAHHWLSHHPHGSKLLEGTTL